MKKEEPVIFSLRKISIEQFAVLYEPVASKNVEFSFLVKIGHNLDNRQIGVSIIFKFLENKIPFLQLETTCHFEIQKDSWDSFPKDSNDNILINKDFIAHLISIQIGSSRGILYAKTENTPNSKYLIPLVNVQKIAKENLIIPTK